MTQLGDLTDVVMTLDTGGTVCHNPLSTITEHDSLSQLECGHITPSNTWGISLFFIETLERRARGHAEDIV